MGVIHLVLTHEGGRGGQANAYECVQGGEGGLTHEVRTQSKTYQLFAYILKYFHLQRSLNRYLIKVVRIQLRLLLAQGC